MTNHWAVRVGWLLVVLVAQLGCDPTGPTPSNPRLSCRARYLAPYRPVMARNRLISGEAGFACRQPPTTHRAALFLEWETPSGAWQVKDRQTSTRVPDATGFLLKVLDDCRVGKWRLRFEVQATDNDRVGRAAENSGLLRIRNVAQCNEAET